MILTISGTPGSGKTAAAKRLAHVLGWEYISVGDLRGALASERGITIDELNALGESDKSTDTIVDERVRQLGKTRDNLIVEGRLAWYFIPHSFKIFLTCDPLEAAKRIFQARTTEQDRADEPLYQTVEEVAQKIRRRIESDRKRYQTHYGLDFERPEHYNAVIDTSDFPDIETTVRHIQAALPPSV